VQPAPCERPVDVAGLTVGVPTNYNTGQVDPQVASAVSAAIAVLVE